MRNIDPKFMVNWSSAEKVDELKLQVIRDILPNITYELLYQDGYSKLQHFTTINISLCDVIESDDPFRVPLGLTQVPIQILIKPVTNINVRIRSDLKIRETLAVLIHEMQHVEQVLTGRLAMGYLDPDTSIPIWEGRAFSAKYFDYERLPWEVEALEFEKEFSKNIDACLTTVSIIE